MEERLLYKIMMFACLVLAGICGIVTVGLLIDAMLAMSGTSLAGAGGMAVGCVGFGWGAVYFNRQERAVGLYSNHAEREVLTTRQQRELRKARGEVVMEKALIEVEHERQNIVHRQIEESNDPDKPPHETRWSTPSPPQIGRKPDPYGSEAEGYR